MVDLAIAIGGVALLAVVVLLWRGRTRARKQPHGRRTQFHFVAVDPAVADHHRAAWEHRPEPAEPVAVDQSSPAHAPTVIVDQSSPAYAPTEHAGISEPARSPFARPVTRQGRTSIGYAVKPPSAESVDVSLDDDGPTATDPRYAEFAQRHYEQLARGSQPTYDTPSLSERAQLSRWKLNAAAKLPEPASNASIRAALLPSPPSKRARRRSQ